MANEITANVSALVSRSAETATRPANTDGVVATDRQKLATSQTGTQATADARHQEAELKQAVSRIQDFVQSVHRELRFSVDEESGRTIIRVIDSETEKVIRQIPPEEAIAVSKQLRELTDGILLRVQA